MDTHKLVDFQKKKDRNTIALPYRTIIINAILSCRLHKFFMITLRYPRKQNLSQMHPNHEK